MSILVETCPKCGAELQNIVIATFPPIPQKKCFNCGWSWTGKPKPVIYKPFEDTEETERGERLKAVMISIRPEWCQKIVNGQKTVEVRKTRPKLDTPFRCYIYRPKGFVPHIINDKWVQMEVGGTVVGEFTCDAITRVNIYGFWDDSGKQLDNRLKETCLTSKEFLDYLGEKVGYGWHISDLRIYDTPKELSEFKTLCRVDADCCACPYYNYTKMDCDGRVIGRPPQSWCYVEELP